MVGRREIWQICGRVECSVQCAHAYCDSSEVCSHWLEGCVLSVEDLGVRCVCVSVCVCCFQGRDSRTDIIDGTRL